MNVQTSLYNSLLLVARAHGYYADIADINDTCISLCYEYESYIQCYIRLYAQYFNIELVPVYKGNIAVLSAKQ